MTTNPNCGGCQGLGSHRRWCVESVGPVASMRGRQAQQAEDLADAVGANHFTASNMLYAVAGLLFEEAKRLATEHQQMKSEQDDITMSHVPGMLKR